MPVRNAESWPREHFYSVTYLFFLPFKTYKTYFLLTHIIFILFFCVSSYGSLFNFGKLLLKLPKKKSICFFLLFLIPGCCFGNIFGQFRSSSYELLQQQVT